MESLWGASHDAKIASFEKKVGEIEEKYSGLLSQHKNRITDEVPDKLNNHYILKWDVHSTGIGFHKDTYLPDYVQHEVIDAFKSEFEPREDSVS